MALRILTPMYGAGATDAAGAGATYADTGATAAAAGVLLTTLLVGTPWVSSTTLLSKRTTQLLLRGRWRTMPSR